jgi:hypothetical protein
MHSIKYLTSWELGYLITGLQYKLQMLLQTCGIVFLTLVINGTTSNGLLKDGSAIGVRSGG